MSLVISGSAGPPSGPENFRPLYSAGLWLAVMLTPPSSLLWMMAWASTGSASAPGRKRSRQPFFRSTPAAVRANSGEKKRVSWPTMSLGISCCAETVPGDGGGRAANAGEGEIVGDHAAPTGGAEMDRLFRHGRLLYLGRRIKITEERRESQE